MAHVAQAFANGATKYGAYNWREEGVGAMTYIGAGLRHKRAWLDGEELAQDSLVHHLAHDIACSMILLDSIALGILVDDRPAKAPTSGMMENVKLGLPIDTSPLERSVHEYLKRLDLQAVVTDVYEEGSLRGPVEDECGPGCVEIPGYFNGGCV